MLCAPVHVTLKCSSPFHSIAFLMYSLIVSLIHLYSVSGRNAAGATTENGSIELAAANKWYSPVPRAELEVESPVHHIIGDEDD